MRSDRLSRVNGSSGFRLFAEEQQWRQRRAETNETNPRIRRAARLESPRNGPISKHARFCPRAYLFRRVPLAGAAGVAGAGGEALARIWDL